MCEAVQASSSSHRIEGSDAITMMATPLDDDEISIVIVIVIEQGGGSEERKQRRQHSHLPSRQRPSSCLR